MQFRTKRALHTALAAIALICAPASASKLENQRQQFPAAWKLAQHGPQQAWKAAARGLEDYPLYPYLEYEPLQRNVDKLDAAEVEKFVATWPDTLLARDLRRAYLRARAKNEDWAAFRQLYLAADADEPLRCEHLRARLAAGQSLDWDNDIAPRWQAGGRISPACSKAFAWASGNGVLTPDTINARIRSAAEAADSATVGSLAGLLSGDARSTAQRLAQTLSNPSGTLADAAKWPDTRANRDAISFGLARYARQNSAAAVTLWSKLSPGRDWNAEQKNRVLAALATYRGASFGDDGLARLQALPDAAHNDVTREWHARRALAIADWQQVLDVLEKMPSEQAGNDRWRYLRARMLAKLGRDDEANAAFRQVASEATFHGFLAADWINAPYSICPLTLAVDSGLQKELARQPDLMRAFEFFELGELSPARREWNFAMEKLEPRQRQLAADLASQRGWYDRAIFAFSAGTDTLRLYEHRFPLAMESRVRKAARDAGIETPWAYAIIRAESAWMPDARSHADARGLMQLLPSTAKQVATRNNIAYQRAAELLEPGLNMQLGTHYLAQMAGNYQGSPWLASAAYNAGGQPVRRWIDARGTLEPDFFIETISYKETREYVARVMAFAVIYDWRLNGSAIPLSARLPRIGQPFQLPDDKSSRKAVVCASAP